jgi:hypothetical protein
MSRAEKALLRETEEAEATAAGIGLGSAVGTGLGMLWAATSDSKENTGAKILGGALLGAFVGGLISS